MSNWEKHTLNTNLYKTLEYETGKKIFTDFQRWRMSLDKKQVNGLSSIAFTNDRRLRAKQPSLNIEFCIKCNFGWKKPKSLPDIV